MTHPPGERWSGNRYDGSVETLQAKVARLQRELTKAQEGVGRLLGWFNATCIALHGKPDPILADWMPHDLPDKATQLRERAEAAEAQLASAVARIAELSAENGRLFRELAEAQQVSERRRLVLASIEGDAGGSCDWGYCNREATGWRLNTDEWLPVCTEHQPEYEAAEAQLAEMRASRDWWHGFVHPENSLPRTCSICAALASTPDRETV